MRSPRVLPPGYLREHRPRVLYVALGETDDWAHERRYDRVLTAASVFDEILAGRMTGRTLVRLGREG